MSSSAPAARNTRTCTNSSRTARAKLNQNAWDYIVGASGTETTMRRNRMALDEIAFRPRVLRNVINVDPSTEVVRTQASASVMIAPVGALEIFDPDAGAAVARGAGTFGAAHMLRLGVRAWPREHRQGGA